MKRLRARTKLGWKKVKEFLFARIAACVGGLGLLSLVWSCGSFTSGASSSSQSSSSLGSAADPTSVLLGGGGGVTNMAVLYGSRQLSSAYSGPLFDVTRLSDGSTLTVLPLSSGLPDLASVGSFLTGTAGFVTKLYDQTGNGFDATQKVLASAPQIDPAVLRSGSPAIIFGYSHRAYAAGFINTTSGYSGNAINVGYTNAQGAGTLSGLTILPGMIVKATGLPSGGTVVVNEQSGNVLTVQAVPAGIAPGMTATWDGQIGTSTLLAINNNQLTLSSSPTVPVASLVFTNRITAYDPGSAQITVQVGPTGALSDLAVTAPPVYMDLPADLSVPWGNHSVFTVFQSGASASQDIVTLGLPATSTNYAAPYSGIFRSALQPTSASSAEQLLILGGNGVATTASSPGTLLTGSLHGNSNAGFYGYTSASVGANEHAISWWSESLTGANSVGSVSSATLTGGSLGYTEQYLNGPHAEGDFNLFALLVTNSAQPNAKANLLQTALNSTFGLMPGQQNAVVFDGSSTTIGVGVPTTESAPVQTGTLISQESGSEVVVYNQASALTIEAQVEAYKNDIASVFDPETSRILVYHPGLGNSIEASAAETGAVAWSAIEQYLEAAAATGYQVILIGSATRGSFTAAQLTQFEAAKALMAANWPSHPNVKAYIDLASLPEFAGNTPWVGSPADWQPDHQHFTKIGYQAISAAVAPQLYSLYCSYQNSGCP